MRGRYSMLGFDPDLIFRAEGGRAEIARAPDLVALRALPGRRARRAPHAHRRKPHRRPAGLPPMSAGVFGYLAYDMVRLMEELPPPKPEADRRRPTPS